MQQQQIDYQDRQRIARQFISDRLILNVYSLVEFLGKCEEFLDEYEDEWQSLFNVPNLDDTHESLKQHNDIFLVTPDDPLTGDWECTYDYIALTFDSKVKLSEDSEADRLLEYYDLDLILDDVYDEGFSLDPDYEESDDFRHTVLVPAIRDYLNHNNMYIVEYCDGCYVLDNPQEIAGGDTLQKMLQDAWKKWDEDRSTEEVFEFYIVDDYLARKLKEKGEPVTEIFNFWIWGRTCTGQLIYCDHVIQEIALEVQ